MTAQILDGKALARTLRGEFREAVAERVARGLPAPTLAVVKVGNDPASAVYVRLKRKDCASVGFRSLDFDMPQSTTKAELLAKIDALNEDPSVDGILVQLPLPEQLDSTEILERIDPSKDVDGFHPYNMGRLAQRLPALRPCTPFGVIRLLEHIGEVFKGRHAVVVGASNIVGRPMSLELLLSGATVTVCHRFTSDLATQVSRADIVVVGVGKPGLVKGEWIKPGATVVDVGITRREDGTLTGDVEFDVAKERAAWITPVPGGVGPMTRAMLLHNTLEAARLRDSSR